MPNHVHVLADVRMTPLWKTVQNWKVRAAREAGKNLRLERRAPARPVASHTINTPSGCSALRQFWQREYWDTFMRDEVQEKIAIRYIENNPVQAKLCSVKEQWPFSSARFRDEYVRLVIPAGTPSDVSAQT
jgi:REP element-mobilizing transposase RayT